MSEFKSLYAALKGWYCRNLAEYPPDLREWVDGRWKVPFAHRVKGVTPAYPGGYDMNTGKLYNWDDLTPAQRIAYAKRWDFEHDPATEAQREEQRAEIKAQEKFYDDHEKLKKEIARWENADAPTVLDMAKRDEILAPLKARFAKMDLELRQRLGDPDADDAVTGARAATNTRKGGRPPVINQKAEILSHLIERMTNGTQINPSELPGSASDLLDACQRMERAKTNKCFVFSTTLDAFKTWLKPTGYGFSDGRTPKAEENYWTQQCVKTMGLIELEVFTGVIPEKPL